VAAGQGCRGTALNVVSRRPDVRRAAGPCRTLLAALAALLLRPTAALADRAPTKAERAGIAKHVDVPLRCLKIRVSTVNTRWASMRGMAVRAAHDRG
jgi:hypothetical protein